MKNKLLIFNGLKDLSLIPKTYVLWVPYIYIYSGIKNLEGEEKMHLNNF